MKLALLVAGSRAGAEFFQSMIDSHPEIVQFPGEIQIDNKFLEILDLEPEKIPKQFTSLFPHFFDSRKNKIERHDKLGRDKNQSFQVSKKLFIENFKFYLDRHKSTKLKKYD